MESSVYVLTCLVVFGTFSLIGGESYKIAMFAGGSKSHKNVFDAVAEELGKRGHQITIYSSVKDEKPVKGVENIYIQGGEDAWKAGNLNFFDGTMESSSFIAEMLKTLKSVCNATYADSAVQDLLNNPRDATGQPRFDAVMTDAIFGEFMLPVAYRLQVPSIYLSPGLLLPSIAWRLNIPFPYSYLSGGADENVHPVGMYGRALNVVKILGFGYFRDHQLQPAWDEVIATHVPDSPLLADLERNVSLAMINWNSAIFPSSPRMPYFVDVGCIVCKERKPLPQDLEDFMNSAPDGVVYFSLGSGIKGTDMPGDMKEKMSNAFAKIKQKVLWKYESTFEVKSPNVKLIKWAPQKDLLGHPKMKLFITHGGGLSMMESAYNGCPQLAFPISADQLSNMAHAKERGFAEVLDWKTFTQEEIDEKLHLMLNDKSYAENAKKVSLLMKDNPIEPREKAAYWVEYVVRHKGASHLKSGAENLNFFQYFLLDVIAAAVLALTLVLAVIFVVLRAVLRLVCGKKCTKEQNKTKKTN